MSERWRHLDISLRRPGIGDRIRLALLPFGFVDEESCTHRKLNMKIERLIAIRALEEIVQCCLQILNIVGIK